MDRTPYLAAVLKFARWLAEQVAAKVIERLIF